MSFLGGVSGAFALVVCAAVAFAEQPRNVECRSTETQAECHARLKCKADEDLQDCQERLRKGGGGGGGERDGDRDGGRDDRGDDPGRGDGRWDRDRDGGGGGSDRGDGRWDRDRGGGGGSDRGGRWDRDRGGRGGGRDGGGGFQANKTFGLGLEVGEPTGLNGKYFLSASGALDFGVGWIYRHYYYDDGLHLYVDYLWHPATLASSPTLELPFYIGLGVRYWDFEYCDEPEPFCYDGSAIGIRIPIGLSLDFNSAPVDIFIQVIPVLDFLTDDYYDRYDDRTHLGVDVSAGIRYWFN